MDVNQGEIHSYYLCIRTPNVASNFKSSIHIRGDFGLAYLNFVPDEGELGRNAKNTKRKVFETYFRTSAWPQLVDLLRNEKPVFFFYNEHSNTAELRTNAEPVGEDDEERE